MHTADTRGGVIVAHCLGAFYVIFKTSGLYVESQANLTHIETG